MKNITEHRGIITDIEYRDTSNNGNNRYTFTLDGLTVITPLDSSLGYSIHNFEGKEVVATVGTHRHLLTLDSIEVTV